MAFASAIGVAARPRLSPPDYVVLGMLRLGARSGYEIKRTVELSIRFFWTISQAQIYPSLKRLESQGLISGRSEPHGKRPRRLFELTATGEQALVEWLAGAQPMALELRDLGMVKLFFAGALERDPALGLLVALRRRSEQAARTLREIEPGARLVAQDGDAFPLLTLRIGIAFHEALVGVCAEFERDM